MCDIVVYLGKERVMEWALESRPLSPAEIPFYNLHYLYACPSPADPTMLWGLDVDMRGWRRTSMSETKPARP